MSHRLRLPRPLYPKPSTLDYLLVCKRIAVVRGVRRRRRRAHARGREFVLFADMRRALGIAWAIQGVYVVGNNLGEVALRTVLRDPGAHLQPPLDRHQPALRNIL